MTRLRALWFVILAACGSGSKPADPTTPATPPTTMASPAVDLQMICDEAKAASTSPTTGSSRDAFAMKVTGKLQTDEGRNIFKAAGAAADAEKHGVIKQGAAEVGVADWECKAAFEAIYGTQADQPAAP